MASFCVNGEKVHKQHNVKLIDYLREDLRLTSVKNGCKQGACGTCMVLADGKATKACVLNTDKLEGKSIVTVEGFSEREKQVYGYAFAKCAAVQCGFCTPGMLISAKALIDQNPSPSRQEIKKAIKNNICRCTGYVKIEQAIELAADMLKNGTQIPEFNTKGTVGEDFLRVDAVDKALGVATYVDDMKLEGMLYGGAVRSKYPRARVIKINTKKAKDLDGVVAVLTAGDIPGNQKIGHLKKDWDVLIPEGKITHYLGDAIALVAAQSRETLEEAKKLIEVEYEQLPGVFDCEQALREDAPKVHGDGNVLVREHLVRGDADEVIRNSKYSVTMEYETPPTEHAFLEPETAISLVDEEGTVVVYCADQGVYQTRKECAEMLGCEPGRVRVISKMVGGGFGGKEDLSVQQHAALLAYHTKRPVKVSLTRDESILVHPKRHAMRIKMTTACDESGKLTAMKARVVADTGAYASLGSPVLQRACTHAAGPYNYQVIDILGTAVYTNNPPAGAFRGFGVTQTCFATESNLNLLAQKVGITPFEMRYKNAIRPGQVLPNGQIADNSTALVETLDEIREEYENNPKAGIACAIKNSGLGVGIPDSGRCRLVVQGDIVRIRTSAACIGQGLATVTTQIVSTVTGISPKHIVHDSPDTLRVPDSGETTASRQSLFTGEAARLAALQLKEALAKRESLEDLDGEEYFAEYLGETDKLGSDKPHPVSHIAYGYATQMVELDDNGKLERVIAVHDVGQVINPESTRGQIEGGVVMSLGYALTEKFELSSGKPLLKFGTLGLFKSVDVPQIDARIVGKPASPLALGAKGVGEICSIPTAPAVALAYYNRDGEFRKSLPLSNTPYEKKKK